jgi:hypothetical protein
MLENYDLNILKQGNEISLEIGSKFNKQKTQIERIDNNLVGKFEELLSNKEEEVKVEDFKLMKKAIMNHTNELNSKCSEIKEFLEKLKQRMEPEMEDLNVLKENTTNRFETLKENMEISKKENIGNINEPFIIVEKY